MGKQKASISFLLPKREMGAKTGAKPRIESDTGEHDKLGQPNSSVLYVRRNHQAIFPEKQIKAGTYFIIS